MKNNQAFTLIELLVVVLIIGILAAVALPQYQKAVEKSRAVQAITLLKSIYNAAKAYQLANGEWPTSVDELAVETPWTGTTNGINIGAHHKQGQSNADWSIQIRNSGSTSVSRGIIISHLSGPYAGSAFAIYTASDDDRIPIDQLLCVEMVSENNYPFTKSKGAYCQKIMKGTLLHTNGEGAWNYFRMP